MESQKFNKLVNTTQRTNEWLPVRGEGKYRDGEWKVQTIRG